MKDGVREREEDNEEQEELREMALKTANERESDDLLSRLHTQIRDSVFSLEEHDNSWVEQLRAQRNLDEEEIKKERLWSLDRKMQLENALFRRLTLHEIELERRNAVFEKRAVRERVLREFRKKKATIEADINRQLALTAIADDECRKELPVTAFRCRIVAEMRKRAEYNRGSSRKDRYSKALKAAGVSDVVSTGPESTERNKKDDRMFVPPPFGRVLSKTEIEEDIDALKGKNRKHK